VTVLPVNLEKLTESYFKYVKSCLVERGRFYQERHVIVHPKIGRFNVSYPVAGDIIAVQPGLEQVELVNCKEKVDCTKAKGLCRKFESQVRWVKKTLQTDRREIRLQVACVKATAEAKKRLKQRGIGLITAKEMLKALKINVEPWLFPEAT